MFARSRLAGALAAGIALAAVMAAPGAHASAPTRFAETDLVSDQAGQARIQDPKLVNAWGLAAGPFTPIWVADNGSDSSTFYVGGTGGIVKVPLDVAVDGGAPTGVVFNDTASFTVKGLPATYVFDSEAGEITAWNLATGNKAVKVASEDGAVYKGITLVHTAAGPRLLAVDFHHHRVSVFDAKFHKVTLPGAFTDRHLPSADYSPFNITTIGGKVYVAYAPKEADGDDEVAGPGNGVLDEYTTGGTFVRRLVTHGALNAPWAIVKAPASFGTFAGDLLVGNFGDGGINAYDWSGHFRGALPGADGKALHIDGLWGLLQGNFLAGGSDALWFAAGPDDEQHGLLGVLKAVRE